MARAHSVGRLAKSSWTIAGPGANLAAMRALHRFMLLALLAGLAGCSCLPGGGATNALDALEEPSSTIVSRGEIPSKRF